MKKLSPFLFFFLWRILTFNTLMNTKQNILKHFCCAFVFESTAIHTDLRWKTGLRFRQPDLHCSHFYAVVQWSYHLSHLSSSKCACSSLFWFSVSSFLTTMRAIHDQFLSKDNQSCNRNSKCGVPSFNQYFRQSIIYFQGKKKQFWRIRKYSDIRRAQCN